MIRTKQHLIDQQTYIEELRTKLRISDEALAVTKQERDKAMQELAKLRGKQMLSGGREKLIKN